MADPAHADRPTALDEQLCFALYSASQHIQSAYAAEFDRLGIDYTQYVALLYLFEGEPGRPSPLAARIGLDSGTAAAVLDKLARSGHLEQVEESGEGGVGEPEYRLTESGERLRRPISLLQNQVRGALDMSDDEIDSLRSLAGRVCRGIS